VDGALLVWVRAFRLGAGRHPLEGRGPATEVPDVPAVRPKLLAHGDARTAVCHDVMQEDGKVIVAGVTGGDWALMRFLGDSASDNSWQNGLSRLDVSGDGNAVPLDVLRVINELNDPRLVDPHVPLPVVRPPEAPFFNVTEMAS
jgi:hypothetical protein